MSTIKSKRSCPAGSRPRRARTDRFGRPAIITPLLLAGWTIFGWTVFAQHLESVQVVDTLLQPVRLLLHPTAGILVVAGFGADRLQVFPLREGCELGPPRTYAAGKGPYALVWNGSGQLLYATYFSEARLGRFRLSAGELIQQKTYPAGRGPADLAVHPRLGLLFVVNALEGSLLTFRQDGGALVLHSNLSLGGRPERLLLHPNGQYLYVAEKGTPSLMLLRVEGRTPLSVVDRLDLQVDELPEDLVFYLPRARLYVSAGDADRVLEFQVAPNGRLQASSSISVGEHPGAMALAEKARKLFVLGRKSNDIHVLDIGREGKLKVVTSHPTVDFPEDLAIRGDCLYVVGSAYGRIHSLRFAP